MPSDQVTYVLVAGLVTGLAILLLLAGAFVARRGSRDERPSAAPAGAPLTVVPPAPGPELHLEPTLAHEPLPEPEPAPGPAPVEPVAAEESSEVTLADLEAAKGRVHDPREEEFIQGFLAGTPRRRDVAAAEADRPPTAVGPADAPAPAPAAEAGPAPAPAPAAAPLAPAPGPRDPYVDEATGLDSRAAWERAVAEENARYVRYRRPVSVVVGEIDGLRHFEEQVGAEAARRILGAVGSTLRRGARRTDRVAHAGGGRFLVLMPETDEIQAINYVERVRNECERWLEAGAVALRLSIGWASPSAVGELDIALRVAEERMYAERRRAARAGTGDAGAPR